MKRIWTGFSILMILAVVLTVVGCSQDPMIKDITAVAKYFKPDPDTLGDGESETHLVMLYGGPYEGGTAVLEAEEEAAFWVKDGIVYVVNEAARKRAPDLEQASPNIKYDQAFIDACYTEE